MQDNTQHKNEQPVGEKNPTLNEPGATVSDYGNVSGGSGGEEGNPRNLTDNADRSESKPLKGPQETLGNP